MATNKQSIVEMDYAAHEANYRGFLNMVKWGVVFLAVLVIALFFIINP